MGNGINDLPLYLRPQTAPVTANKPDDVEEPAENTESNGVRAFSPLLQMSLRMKSIMKSKHQKP